MYVCCSLRVVHRYFSQKSMYIVVQTAFSKCFISFN